VPDLPEIAEPKYLFLAIQILLLIGWIAWWLLCVNWKKAWKVLAEGAWTGLVLLLLLTALVWSRIVPTTAILFGAIKIPNFWWQLGAASGLVLLALFCGWLQGVFGWTVLEVNVEPLPSVSHDDGHGHGANQGNGHAASSGGHGH
jgi:hypothetical protein